MTSTEKLLDRLRGVKHTGNGRWIARCPAHQDRSPSLSIRETADGRVLLHDFGGCPTGDVLAALGLELRDLFDRPLADRPSPLRAGPSAREILEVLASESTVLAIAAADLASGREVSAADAERVAVAAARISTAKGLAYGHG